VAVLPVQRPPPGLLPWLHAYHPFAAKTNPPPSGPPCRDPLSMPRKEDPGTAEPPTSERPGKSPPHVRRAGPHLTFNAERAQLPSGSRAHRRRSARRSACECDR
jgi:hypothetical protein